MIVINGLEPSMMAERNFNDFDNMVMGIDCKDSTADCIAVLVIDKVRLECDSSRLNDVSIWFSKKLHCGNRCTIQTLSSNIDYGTNVGDIED